MPGTYLPAYASSLRLPASTGTIAVALMNLARVPGQIILGYVSDKMSARPLILLVCVCSTVTAFTWGAADTTPGILAFSLAFGSVAGSYTALFPRFIAVVSDDSPAVLYSMFSCKSALYIADSRPRYRLCSIRTTLHHPPTPSADRIRRQLWRVGDLYGCRNDRQRHWSYLERASIEMMQHVPTNAALSQLRSSKRTNCKRLFAILVFLLHLFARMRK